MKFLLIALAFAGFTAHASTLNLKCEASLNSDKLFEVQVELPKGERNFLIAKTDEYQFFLSSNAHDVLELQIYNRSEPSRSYATTNLEKSGQVELILWKRESLLEMRCSKIN